MEESYLPPKQEGMCGSALSALIQMPMERVRVSEREGGTETVSVTVSRLTQEAAADESHAGRHVNYERLPRDSPEQRDREDVQGWGGGDGK